MYYKDSTGAVYQIARAYYKDVAGVVHPLGRAFYKDTAGNVSELRFGSLVAYQKYVSADLLKPKYSPNHGLYVGYKMSENRQPYYSADLINWTRFTNIYYQEGGSFGGGMGEVYPMLGKLFVIGWFNSVASYGGRAYLYAYDTPTSAYNQVAQAGNDGSIYPIINKGVGFYTSYIGNGGAKTSLVSSDAVNWANVTYRANGRGGAASDGKIFVINDDITQEFQLAEIDAITKAEKLMYVGSGLLYSAYGQLSQDTFCDAAGYYYWSTNAGNGRFLKMPKGSYTGDRPIAVAQTNIPAPVKLLAYSPHLGMVLAVDINNKVYECPTDELTNSSIFTLVDANLGTTINSIAVGNNEFIVQSNLGIFVLK